ncbi:MAG TPA: hypothetical protein VHP83_07015 [Aggregatilineaceae bacterium]|nr:hypothetical protein [Aggregatilineaceae bacterium]
MTNQVSQLTGRFAPRLSDLLKPYWISLIISFSISLAIVHSSINLLNENELGGLVDAEKYVAVYNGEDVSGHWGYRVVTPTLARLVPDQIEQLLQRDPTPFRQAHAHFAVINLIFLTLSGVLLYEYLSDFFNNFWLILIGIVIFLTSRTNIQSAGAPLVDAGANFFLLLGMLGIARQNITLVFLASTIGTFTKETTILLWALLWLANIQSRRKITLSIALLPGTLGYLTYRFLIDPDGSGGSYFTESINMIPDMLETLVTPNGIMDWISSFNLFWIPAIYALFRCDIPILLRRWLWFVPLVIVMILLLQGNLGRILFMTFPVVIPLALIGMQEYLGIGHEGNIPREHQPGIS